MNNKKTIIFVHCAIALLLSVFLQLKGVVVVVVVVAFCW